MRLVPCLLLVLAFAAGCGSDDEGGSPAATPTASATTKAADGRCQDVQAPAPKPDGGAKKPSGRLDPTRTWTVTFKTSCGSFGVRLDVKRAPRTAASFASLARQGFYDGTVFHRIVPGFVIQGGDPTASGQGGPGYSVTEAPPKGLSYGKGVVAMAKTGTEPAGTSGSQFFVVTGDAGLPPDYALAGTVATGQATVDAIGRLGDPSTEQPTQAVVVDSAAVSSR